MPDTARIGFGGRVLHVATILTGSFLLFLVQPMIARMALPLLGGAPAVWNSAMLVYQALLLGGYAYAHALGRMSPRGQAAIHVGMLLLACLWLPIGLMRGALPANAEPVLWVPWLLGLSIGPLFLAVSAQAPLIQRWFNLSSGGRDPYALYAASNLGSFGGLIAYPLLAEPLMSLRMQSLTWSAGYAVLLLMVAACALFLPARTVAGEVAPTGPAPGRRRVARWIVLAFVPSGLMLATSTYITTDIVAMPLLWVLPLGLYLLSFSVAFARGRGAADALTRFAPITILLFGGVMIGGYQERPFFGLVIALILLFIASVALHTALYRARPDPDRLTGFYLAMAFGGALGGVFAGLVAPVVFDWTYEFPLLILAAGILVPQVYLTGGLKRVWTESTTGRRVAFATVIFALALLFVLRFQGPGAMFGEDRQGFAFLVVAALGVATLGARLPYAVLLASALLLFGGYRAIALSLDGEARQRSYFGVYTVRDGDRSRTLEHGTTVHGIQLLGSKARERTPTTYYAPGSGVGQAMTLAPALYGAAPRIGVVGLGTGTLACYARPGERFRFYEIDPVIARIARTRFTYLADCAPDADIRIGDARLSLAVEPTASLDLLALDAFSSDAVPMHLMTREAFATYAGVLAPRGLLLVHISNRYLDLEPVVAAAARAGGWRGARFHYRPSSLDRPVMASASVWLALSRDPAVLARLEAGAPGWKAIRPRPGFAGWTDDYATILPLIDLSGGR